MRPRAGGRASLYERRGMWFDFLLFLHGRAVGLLAGFLEIMDGNLKAKC